MRIAAQKINKGMHLNKALLEQVERKYIKLYGRRCNELYDMGYLSSPFLFDEADFLSVLFEEYPDMQGVLTNTVDHKIPKNEEFLDYIIKITDSEFLKSLLSKYKDLISCQQAFKDFAYLYSHAKFFKRSDLLLIKPKLIVTSRVENTSFINLDSKYVRECINIEDDFVIKSLNLGDILLRYLAIDINKESLYTYCKEHNTSLFNAKLTFEDDCNLVELILQGKIITDSEFSNALIERLETYYKEFSEENNSNVTCLPYSEFIFLKAVDSMIEKVKSFREEHPDIIETYVTTDKLYYKERGIKDSSVDYTVGLITKDYTTGEDLDDINKLRGYSGVFIKESEINTEDCVFGCSPIIFAVDVDNNVYESYYPICCVFDKDSMTLKYSSIYKFENYKYKNFVSICKALNIASKTDDGKFKSVNDLVQYIMQNNAFSNADLASKLLQSVLAIECDMQTVESNIQGTSNYHFVLSSDSDSSVDRVLAEVRILLKKLEY